MIIKAHKNCIFVLPNIEDIVTLIKYERNFYVKIQVLSVKQLLRCGKECAKAVSLKQCKRKHSHVFQIDLRKNLPRIIVKSTSRPLTWSLGLIVTGLVLVVMAVINVILFFWLRKLFRKKHKQIRKFARRTPLTSPFTSSTTLSSSGTTTTIITSPGPGKSNSTMTEMFKELYMKQILK